MVDRERLEAMRAYADEVREDLERRELEEPFLPLPPVAQVSPPLVFKTNQNALAKNANFASLGQPPFDDFQIDIMAKVIAEIRHDTQAAIDAALAPLRERAAVLEGKIELLTALLGGDANQRSVEASEVVRKLKVQR